MGRQTPVIRGWSRFRSTHIRGSLPVNLAGLRNFRVAVIQPESTFDFPASQECAPTSQPQRLALLQLLEPAVHHLELASRRRRGPSSITSYYRAKPGLLAISGNGNVAAQGGWERAAASVPAGGRLVSRFTAYYRAESVPCEA